MENELKKLDIDKLPLPKLMEALRQAAKSCQCEGTRETTLRAYGRLKNLDIDNLPCPSWWKRCARPPKAANAKEPGKPPLPPGAGIMS